MSVTPQLPAILDLELTPSPIKAVNVAARVSHASMLPTDIDQLKLVKQLLDWEHFTPFEFIVCRFTLLTDRAIANELVRHRMASFVQESTRYVRYDTELPTVYPRDFAFTEDEEKADTEEYRKKHEAAQILHEHCEAAQAAYNKIIALGFKPEIARAALPQCTATKITVTMNFRELVHMLKLRTGSGAHPDMRRIMAGLIRAIAKKDEDWALLLQWALHGTPDSSAFEPVQNPDEQASSYTEIE